MILSRSAVTPVSPIWLACAHAKMKHGCSVKVEAMELERKLRGKLRPPQKKESTEQAINRIK